jgi:hypothetical protein
MNLHPAHTRQFVANLELMRSDDRRTAFANAVIEAGGTFPMPLQDANSSLVEVQLHEVAGQGFGIDDAISDWMMKATSHLNTLEADGFITHSAGVP